MEASQKKCDVTIQFLVGGLVFSYSLCRNFPLIFLRSKLIQEFHACAMVKNVFQFLGANMTPKNFVANIKTTKGTLLRKSASIDAFWSRWLLPFGLWRSGRIKKGKHFW
jgi:hypothetical protein